MRIKNNMSRLRVGLKRTWSYLAMLSEGEQEDHPRPNTKKGCSSPADTDTCKTRGQSETGQTGDGVFNILLG